MITKVTSANYNAYTLLFNQADAALKEYNGEPTTDFIEATSFDPTVQYFDAQYKPIDLTAQEFAARGEEKYYILNEQVIYNLDTYFNKLPLLKEIDYTFLRMPIDEPTFDILDDSANGRHVIKVPEDFARHGISVQGDETAEILFFSIDRYYDAVDLWDADMHYIIQWQIGDKKGVTRAFLNKDEKPFIDSNEKLYFGWPISSEITSTPGNVNFSVRIFKLSDGSENHRPKLAFGFNTQAATVKINESLVFELTEDGAGFEDAITVNKNSDLIARVVQSTIFSEDAVDSAPTPAWNDGTENAEDHNILTDDDLATAYTIKNVIKETTRLASGSYNEEVENGPFYVWGEENGERVLEEVTGLTEDIYRPNVYLVKEETSEQFYEFDAVNVIDKIQQVQAFAPSGVITYAPHSCAVPGGKGAGGSIVGFDAADSIVYVHVTDDQRLPNHRYYELDKTTGKMKTALNIATEIGEDWDDVDKNLGQPQYPCKYFERISPLLEINPEHPVGCYWVTAYNNDGKKAMSSLDSYKIWIPGPETLTEENISLNDENLNESGQERIKTVNGVANFGVSTTNIAAHNDIKFEWTSSDENEELDDTARLQIEYDANDLALLDKVYTVKCHAERNNERTRVEDDIERTFRVTAPAQKFVFDTVVDTPGEEAHPTDRYKVVTQYVADLGEEEAYQFEIDFSENLDNEDNLKMVSDKVAYRFRTRVRGSATGEGGTDLGVFSNDVPMSNYAEGNHFILVDSYEDIPILHAPDHTNPHYCEVINIVNEDVDAFMAGLNEAADAVATNINYAGWWGENGYENRIARTPYYFVQD